MPARKHGDWLQCAECSVTFRRTGRGLPKYCCAQCKNRYQHRSRTRFKGGVRPFASALDLSMEGAALRERFWSKVEIGAADRCWPWTHSSGNKAGHGQFALRAGWMMVSSRVAYALENGRLQQGEVVRHTCDNPPCCNPAHLLKGSNRDNTMDSVTRGRANRSHGSSHRDARLNAEAVRVIRATPLTYGAMARLAREYGVSHTAIRRVLAGKTWRSVT